MRIVTDQEPILKIFRITGLDRVFDLVPTLAEALGPEASSMADPRERAVRMEIPADPRFAAVARMAVGSAAAGWGGVEDARDLAASVGEALVLVGHRLRARTGPASSTSRSRPAGVSVTVTGPGPVPDGDEGEMARLMLAGLTDEFTESAGTGAVTITLSKAFSAVQ